MHKDDKCYFCKEIEDPVQNVLKKSRIVLETKNFVVFPTEGCFQIGYLLILPKQHYLCFGELDLDMINELKDTINRITDYVRKKRGLECIIFEHGTRSLDELITASVMHAHIHIIPFSKNLLSFLPDYCKLKKIQGFTDLKNETENYLYLRDMDGNNYIVENDGYPSQFFRQIACKAMGIPKYWDWRQYKFIENMDITIDFYNEL